MSILSEKLNRDTVELMNAVGLMIGLCSILVFIFWQMGEALQSRKSLNLTHQSQAGLVQQSESIQGNTQTILNDLITLSETNASAKAVIEKYGVMKSEESVNVR